MCYRSFVPGSSIWPPGSVCLQPTWRNRGPREPRNPVLGSCGLRTPQVASGHTQGQAGQHRMLGERTLPLKPAPHSSQQGEDGQL